MKIPTFKSWTVDGIEETQTILNHNVGNQKELNIQTLEVYTTYKGIKKFDIVFRKPPFIPLKIFKLLLKIGLSLLQKEYDKVNKHFFNWLPERQVHIEFIYFAFIMSLKRKYISTPSADLYRVKQLVKGKSEFQEHILILSIVNQIIQMVLPLLDD